jgi:hypothetical protein
VYPPKALTEISVWHEKFVLSKQKQWVEPEGFWTGELAEPEFAHKVSVINKIKRKEELPCEEQKQKTNDARMMKITVFASTLTMRD